MIDLDELERLAKAATPGPWHTEYTKIGDGLYGQLIFDSKGETIAQLAWHKRLKKPGVMGTDREENAAYITAACNAVPELIEMYRKAKDKANDADTAYQMVDRDNVDLTRHILELRAKVAELERQREFFLSTLKENNLCPAKGRCWPDGSELEEWDCSAANNRECWITAAKEAGE